jgi:hypothetical protein
MLTNNIENSTWYLAGLSVSCAGIRIHALSCCHKGVQLSRFPPKSNVCSLFSTFSIRSSLACGGQALQLVSLG